MSSNSPTTYQIRSSWEIEKDPYDGADERKSDSLDELIAAAAELTEVDGHTRYITKTVHIIKPVKQPYEVTTEEFSTDV